VSGVDGAYPDWALALAAPGQTLGSDREAMERAIALARASIENSAGGPFGALIVDGGGRVVALGFNEAVPACDPTAHAEVQAIRRAARALSSCRLRGDGVPPLKLVTSSAPCILCIGAIHWAGVPEVLAAARREDAEALGFIEGPSGFDAGAFLAARGIRYREGFLRERAVEVLRSYRGPIYNA
jgi:tRNA(Arg) A34 adenosine deaminase TadA